MSKVQVKITPTLAGALNRSGSEWLILDKEVVKPTTLGDLFTEIALSDSEFRKVIFNPDSGEINDLVIVVLNDKLLQVPKMMEYILKDGDTVILLPVYMGG